MGRYCERFPAKIIRVSPIAFQLVPSFLLAACLLLGHAVVALAMLYAQPNAIGMMFALMAGVSLYWSLGRHALQWFARAPVSLRIAAENALVVGLRGGLELQGQVLAGSFVHPWITVLNVRPSGGRVSYHVILVPDGADADTFRRLRIWLRWTSPAKDVQDDSPQ